MTSTVYMHILICCFAGGCSTYGDICVHRDAIARLEEETTALKATYDEDVRNLQRKTLYARDCEYNNRYINHYSEAIMDTVVSMEEIYDDIIDQLVADSELINHINETSVMLDIVEAPFEYSLAELEKMIDQTRTIQLVGFGVQLLMEITLNRFVNVAKNAYNRVISEEIADTFMRDFDLFEDNPADSPVIKQKKAWYKRFASKVKKEAPRIGKTFKEMARSPKRFIQKLHRGAKKWGRIKNMKGFKGKLRHTLRKPIAKLNRMKTAIKTPGAAIKKFKLTGTEKFMSAMSVIGDSISMALNVVAWRDVRDKMLEARQHHEEYKNDLLENINLVRSGIHNMTEIIDENIRIFESLVTNFTSIVINVTHYDMFANVHGGAGLPVNYSAPIFTTDFRQITGHNLREKQNPIVDFMKESDNNMTQVEHMLKARYTLYELVGEGVTDSEPITDMFSQIKRIYSHDSSSVVAEFGSSLDQSDVVCAVAKLNGQMTEYDFYNLLAWRPLCRISEQQYEEEKQRAQDAKSKAILINRIQSVVPGQQFNDESVEDLLDRAKQDYSDEQDQTIQRYGEELTTKDVICAVAMQFPDKAQYAFFDLTVLRTSCGRLNQVEFDSMVEQVATHRAKYDSIRGDLLSCIRRGMGGRRCDCIDDQAEFYNLTRDQVKYYMKKSQPQLSQYCGSSRYCDCENL